MKKKTRMKTGITDDNYYLIPKATIDILRKDEIAYVKLNGKEMIILSCKKAFDYMFNNP